MTTHSFQQGSGFKVTGGTGGVSGGGSGSIAGTTVTEEVRDRDDGGGSNLLGISYSQVGFANAPSNSSAFTDGIIRWYRSGTSSLRLEVRDDSNSSGEAGSSDLTFSNRPSAAGSPSTNSFADATGDYSADTYNISTHYYRAQNYQDGEGFTDTFYVAEWNNTTILSPGGVGPLSTGQTFTGSDGNTYKLGASQGTSGTSPNDREDWAIAQLEAASEEHYQFNADSAITGIRGVFTPTTSSSVGTGGGGAIQPLRTFDGTTVPNNTTLSAIDSGWKTSSGDMSTGISLAFIHTTGSQNDSSATYILDGKLELYARTATSGDILMKDIRIRAYTNATSTY